MIVLQGEMKMGNVYAEITLKNVGDLYLVKNGYLEESSVRATTVNALVDTGAWTLVINEAVREKLGLEVREDDWATMANGVMERVKKVEPVEVHWESRTMTCQPVLLPEADEILLGAIPLEDMDLLVDPNNQELVVRSHEDRKYRRI